jgi:hypothetical protein
MPDSFNVKRFGITFKPATQGATGRFAIHRKLSVTVGEMAEWLKALVC